MTRFKNLVFVVQLWKSGEPGCVAGVMSSYNQAIDLADQFEDGYTTIMITEVELDKGTLYL